MRDITLPLPAGVATLLDGAARFLHLLPPEVRSGHPDRYLRHIVHTDPEGRFTAACLVWRPGQQSPVHGHHAWCAYAVVTGALHEEHFNCDDAGQGAYPCGSVDRIAGQTVYAQPGLSQIHRLCNRSSDLAISLHVYGVKAEEFATRVNRLVPEIAAPRFA